MVRKKKTMEAPKAVTNQVKVVANSADQSGPMRVQNSNMVCMPGGCYKINASFQYER
jgi:hypothetical protein